MMTEEKNRAEMRKELNEMKRAKERVCSQEGGCAYKSKGAHRASRGQGRLPATRPMQQTNGPRVQVTATTPDVIPAQTVLVPAVLNGRHVSREDKQKRRQRTELVDPIALLNLHPPLYPFRVPLLPPLGQIHHHHPCVEVTRPPLRERPR
ncbi:hypothetical protein CR513_25787, partial [Mucuna pruriens]